MVRPCKVLQLPQAGAGGLPRPASAALPEALPSVPHLPGCAQKVGVRLSLALPKVFPGDARRPGCQAHGGVAHTDKVRVRPRDGKITTHSAQAHRVSSASGALSVLRQLLPRRGRAGPRPPGQIAGPHLTRGLLRVPHGRVPPVRQEHTTQGDGLTYAGGTHAGRSRQGHDAAIFAPRPRPTTSSSTTTPTTSAPAVKVSQHAV
mmetsp:Transcript_25396/g.73326  ORF Transcript_25396/g.73326 Transcript_25396/m.73326 type:complete len:204 (+) Transcript_25396:790-1401(+)